MPAPPPVLARGISDDCDRLIFAEEPLAELQRNCGGSIPGVIAVPELLELVRKARQYRLKLARPIAALENGEMVRAWVEIVPHGIDDAQRSGCDILVQHWQARNVTPANAEVIDSCGEAIDRQLAALTVLLDGSQRILAVVNHSNEFADVAARMAAGIGRQWSEFLAPEGREWRVVLLPKGQPGRQPVGFELLLLSDTATQFEIAASETVLASDEPLARELSQALQQPLPRIIANADVIYNRLAGPVPDAYAEYAGEIVTAGELLLSLLDDLESFDGLGSRSVPELIDLARVARQAAGLLGTQAREKGINIEAPRMTECLPAVAELRRVLQILLNLVGNAIRHAPGNSSIRLQLDNEGGRPRLIVADEGNGIALNDAERIFDKFERLDQKDDGGAGLGLYISRSLAREMGGDLTVESEPGRGARFILELPSQG